MSENQTINVCELTKKYGDFTAVNNINLTVDRGEIVAILGPNGAGKTSLIEMLEGYRQPTSGSIKILGCEPKKGNRAWRSKVGMVLQSTSLDREMKVNETLSMYEGLYANPLPAAEVIELVGLQNCTNQRIGHLSGGQQRRVDLAIGIIGRPELLFLDEPTTGFDPVSRRESWGMIKRLCGEAGMSVVLTTHYMDEAKFLADRVLVMVNGEIIANAAPDEVGGSLCEQSTIGFNLPQPELAHTIPRVAGHPLSLSGNYVSLLTRHVHRAIDVLMQWANDHSVELSNLTITKPNLEEVYIQLVNNHLSAVAS